MALLSVDQEQQKCLTDKTFKGLEDKILVEIITIMFFFSPVPKAALIALELICILVFDN